MTQTDLSDVIKPKSDQLNADDLIAGAITVRITKVSKRAGEQPVAYNYEGDNGKPYYPCKSMMRVMVHVWGKYAESHVGHSMTLFRDPSVTWGGAEVGGIRISHMSGIDKPVTMSLTATRKARKPYTVQPLTDSPAKPAASAQDKAEAAKQKAAAIVNEIKRASEPEELAAIFEKNAAILSRLENGYSALYKTITDARDAWVSAYDNEEPII